MFRKHWHFTLNKNRPFGKGWQLHGPNDRFSCLTLFTFGFHQRWFTALGEVGGRQTCDSDAWNLPSQCSHQAPGSGLIPEDFSENRALDRPCHGLLNGEKFTMAMHGIQMICGGCEVEVVSGIISKVAGWYF